jgi:hypothetical protein
MRASLAVMAKVAFVIFALIVATPLPASADDCQDPSSTTDVNCPVTGGSFFRLINIGSDKCFEPNPQDSQAGLPIQQRTCDHFNPNPILAIQSYQFQPLGYVIYNGQPPWYCPWCIKLGAEGFFILHTFVTTTGTTNVFNNLCMDVRDGAKSDRAVVQQWTCRDSRARSMVWYTSKGDFPGTLKVRNVNSDLCLDVRGGSSDEGAQLQQYHCTSNNPAQNFCQTNTPDIGTVIDMNGNWTDGSTRSAHIYEGCFFMIDMSAFGRPNANGSVIDPSTITVNFPDDKTYTGQLQPPNTIRWSNGSVWTKIP